MSVIERIKISACRNFKTKTMVWLSTIAIFAVFFAVLCPGLWSEATSARPSGTVKYTEDSWMLENDDGSVSCSIKGDEYFQFRRDRVYRMHTKITYDGSADENPYMFLQISHRFCRVFLDDQLLFSYLPEDVRKWDNARSPGYIYRAIPLPENYTGKEMTVEFMPVLKVPMEYEVPEVYFGDYGSTIKAIIKQDLIHNIIAILCILLGLSALIFSASAFRGSDYREGLFIGLFSLLVSVYFLTDCETNYYFIGNPYYAYLMNLMSLSLMPLSFMGVMREFLEGSQRKICTMVAAAEAVFFFIEAFLHFTGIADMREFLSVIHMIGFAEVILVFALFANIKDRKKRNSLVYQLMPIAVGMVADAVIYWYHIDIGLYDSTFTTIGLLIFLSKQFITKVVMQARRISDMQQHTIEGMAILIESRDGSTGNHVRNTGIYARMIAEEMFKKGMYPKEIDREFISRMGWMAQLHDVGKIKISDTILNKPGKLTLEEQKIMQTHAALGGDIIKKIMSKDMEPDVLKMASDVATYHHERWDGKGYPEGLKGSEIPLCARIMAVADVMDALSSKRIYKDEMDIKEVFRILKENEGTQFQKEIVEAALEIEPELEEKVRQNKINNA